MLVIGLTGGIATGKSTVSKELARHGLPVIDADIIAREVVAPGTKGHKQIVEAFQADVPDLLQADGGLNRPALGKHVFGNKERLGVLNKIVHGAVRREIFRQLFWYYLSGKSMVVLDVPLLFESGLNKICGTTIVVSTSEDTQLKRLLERNPELTQEDAKKRISSQMATEERNARGDKVMDNDSTIESLQQQVVSAIEGLAPSKIWTVLDLFPPFGLLSAAITLSVNAVRDIVKAKSRRKQD